MVGLEGRARDERRPPERGLRPVELAGAFQRDAEVVERVRQVRVRRPELGLLHRRKVLQVSGGRREFSRSCRSLREFSEEPCLWSFAH